MVVARSRSPISASVVPREGSAESAEALTQKIWASRTAARSIPSSSICMSGAAGSR